MRNPFNYVLMTVSTLSQDKTAPVVVNTAKSFLNNKGCVISGVVAIAATFIFGCLCAKQGAIQAIEAEDRALCDIGVSGSGNGTTCDGYATTGGEV